ncbi:MAG: hypothetical protein KatS3mg058_2131 [Roseiflexus sp.]|nr:MAG: hypothetical protein KatS3mg058_2131 [Roseiflexus sp.]
MRDNSRATPLLGTRSPLASPPMRENRALRLVGPARRSPLASPQMRDTSRATPWSGPCSPLAARLSTNARYISRYAMVGTSLARSPLASPQMRDTSPRYAIVGTRSPLSPLHTMRDKSRASARWVGTTRSPRAARALCARNATHEESSALAPPLVGPRLASPARLSPLHKCEINLALRHGRDPLASHRSPLASHLSTNAR